MLPGPDRRGRWRRGCQRAVSVVGVGVVAGGAGPRVTVHAGAVLGLALVRAARRVFLPHFLTAAWSVWSVLKRFNFFLM
jgi:hypothetical protein